MATQLTAQDAVVAAVRSMTDLGQLGSYALPQSRVTISTVGALLAVRFVGHVLVCLRLFVDVLSESEKFEEMITYQYHSTCSLRGGFCMVL